MSAEVGKNNEVRYPVPEGSGAAYASCGGGGCLEACAAAGAAGLGGMGDAPGARVGNLRPAPRAAFEDAEPIVCRVRVWIGIECASGRKSRDADAEAGSYDGDFWAYLRKLDVDLTTSVLRYVTT
jgi:hypothetical protein